ncbi:hypothetical protein FHT70_005827 [Rhizobium sp. BK049]|nr:hypothetical protein [Rhizobium sp. BK049]
MVGGRIDAISVGDLENGIGIVSRASSSQKA